MPLVRTQVKNEYALGKPELYKQVNKDDPKAVLDGIAVAGLVGILRQLGDLAEFASEVFHGLQEQVTNTSSRSCKLSIRVKRIEAALPPLEKAVLSQTSHIHFAYTTGSHWHPRMRNEKNNFICNDLPCFIMGSYEVCRDPPPLHLLDKFDAGGPGSCLKRYSDPTYFKTVSGISTEEEAEKVPRNKKTRKSKKRRSSHRNGKLSRGASLLNHSVRMQFTSPIHNGRISSSQTASTVDMTPKSEVREHSNSFDSITASVYNESASELGSSMFPEELEPKELSSRWMHETYTLGSDFPVEQTRVIDDNLSHSSSQEQIAPSPSYVTWDEKAEILESKAGNWDRGDIPGMNFDVDVQETGAATLGDDDQVDIPFNHMDAPRLSSIENRMYEIESEPDYYMDALNTLEIESESDVEFHTKREVEQWSENDVECQTKWEVEQNDGANHVNIENREDGMPEVTDYNVEHHPSIFESSASSNIISRNGICTSLPVLVPSENFTSEQMLQFSGRSSDADNLPCTDLCMSDEIHAISQVESLISDPFEAYASSNIISSNGISTNLPDPVHSENFASKQMLQISGRSSDPDNLPNTDLCTSDEIHNISQVESIISDPYEVSASSNIISSNGISTSLPDPVPSENFASEQMLQISGRSSDPDNLPSTDLCTGDEIHNSSQVESIISDPYEVSASSNIISSTGISTSFPDPVPSENFSSEQMLQQISGRSSDPDNLPSNDLCTTDEIHNISQVESIISDPYGVFTSSNIISSTGISTSFPDPVPSENFASEEMLQTSGRSSDPDNLSSIDLCTSDGIHNISQVESVISDPDETSASSNIFSSSGISMTLPDPVPSENFASEQMVQVSGKSYDTDNLSSTDLCSSDEIHRISQVESVMSDPSSSSGSSVSDPTSDRIINSITDSQNSRTKFSGVHSVGLWTNGGLLGLQPSKPPDFAVSTTGQGSAAKTSEAFGTRNGLGHKLFVNEFHRKLSIGHDGDSETATSTKTGVIEQRNGHQSTSNPKNSWAPFNEKNGNGSPVNSLTSSPPLEHMKISFNPIDGFETSKLSLQFPNGNYYYEEIIRDMFPSFQLVPVPAIPVHDDVSDSDDDTFCRSSPYMSDDCFSRCSESNSEQWETGEAPKSKDPELYDALSIFSSMESVSSSLQIGEAANNGIYVNGRNKTIGNWSDAELSLLVLPDLPSFDAVNPVLQDEPKSNSNQNNHQELQNSMELTSLPPPPPPAQWRVLESFDEAEERQHALSASLRQELDVKLLESTISQKPKPPSVNQQQTDDDSCIKTENKVDHEKLNRRKEANQQISSMEVDEKEEFLHQIRTKRQSHCYSRSH